MSMIFLGRADSEISERLASMDTEEIRQVKSQCEDNMCSCKAAFHSRLNEYRGCRYCPYESRVVQLCQAELNLRQE